MAELDERFDVSPPFEVAPQPPRLVADEIHLWHVPLEASPEGVARLSSTLSADERRRAERYRFDRHRRRFTVGRGHLRSILARYVGESPARLEFRYGQHGKPALGEPWADAGLSFNATDSSELALLAVAVDREVGIDVERLRPMKNATGLAARYFADAERRALESLSGPAQLRAFFNTWTRKEAFLKAIGTGLSFGLDRVVVSLLPGEPSRFRSIDGDEDEARRWWLESIDPCAGYVAAVTARGDPLRVRRWRADVG